MESLTDLPDKLIEKILSLVTRKFDRRNLALVCKKFHSIVRSQSKQYQVLPKLSKDELLNLKSVFKDSDIFPFQKAYVESEIWSESSQDFWQNFGPKFVEIYVSLTSEKEPQKFWKIISEIIKFFPNLQTLRFTGLEGYHKLDELHALSETDKLDSLEQLEIASNQTFLHKLGSLLRHFPNLKRLKLDLSLIVLPKDEDVQVFRDLLSEWVVKLASIQLEIPTSHLLEPFDGLESEKLIFNLDVLELDQDLFKSFFSKRRIVRKMKVSAVTNGCEENLIALMNQNAKIDVLQVNEDSGQQLWNPTNRQSFERFYNLSCVKEIHIYDTLPRHLQMINFSTEVASKVTELKCSQQTNVFGGNKIYNGFQNLRLLHFSGIQPGELQCLAEKFPKLIELRITNGYLDRNKMKSSFSNLKMLKQLEIFNCFVGPLNDEFLDKGLRLPNLRTLVLHFGDHRITMKGIKSLASHCPKLESLELVGQKNLFGTHEDQIQCLYYLFKNHFFLEDVTIAAPLFQTAAS